MITVHCPQTTPKHVSVLFLKTIVFKPVVLIKLIIFLKPLLPLRHHSIIPATRFSGRAGEL